MLSAVIPVNFMVYNSVMVADKANDHGDLT